METMSIVMGVLGLVAGYLAGYCVRGLVEELKAFRAWKAMQNRPKPVPERVQTPQQNQPKQNQGGQPRN